MLEADFSHLGQWFLLQNDSEKGRAASLTDGAIKRFGFRTTNTTRPRRRGSKLARRISIRGSKSPASSREFQSKPSRLRGPSLDRLESTSQAVAHRDRQTMDTRQHALALPQKHLAVPATPASHIPPQLNPSPHIPFDRRSLLRRSVVVRFDHWHRRHSIPQRQELRTRKMRQPSSISDSQRSKAKFKYPALGQATRTGSMGGLENLWPIGSLF